MAGAMHGHRDMYKSSSALERMAASMTCGMTTEPHGPEKESHRSLAEDALDLGIQRLPLRGLAVHGAETLNIQLLPCLLHGFEPFLQRACCPRFLSCGRCRLAHNPTRLVLD